MVPGAYMLSLLAALDTTLHNLQVLYYADIFFFLFADKREARKGNWMMGELVILAMNIDAVLFLG